MTLRDYYNKKVKIIDRDGAMFEGDVNDYIFPEDNPDGEESIILDTISEGAIEFRVSDILSIAIV